MKKLFLLLLMAITANVVSGQMDAKFNPAVYTKPLPRIITVANQPSDFRMTTHVVNIKVPTDSAKKWNPAMEKRYIKRLFTVIKDVDCLVLNYSGFFMVEGAGGYTINNGFQFFRGIRNEIANIGLPQYNTSAEYGSDKLLSLTTLSEANALRPEIVVHEFFHHWNSYMEYANYWLMNPDYHTGLVEDDNTVFEGLGHYSDFKTVRDGVFSYKSGFCTGFPGKLQGYLAGLWDMPDELKTIKNYWNDGTLPSVNNGDGTMTYQIKADSLVILNKARLFNVCGGERFPNYQNSKKHFDAAIVVFSLNDFISDDKLKGFHYMSMLNELEGTPTEYNSLYDQVCLEGYIYENADFGHRQTNIYHSTYGKFHYSTRLFNDDSSVFAVPNYDGKITGNTSVCSGTTNVVYSIPPIKYAASYVWTLPSGVSGTSTTNSITVNYDAAATSGDITVKGRNASGDGNLTVMPIHILDSKSLPAMPDPIVGRKIVCAGQRFLSYTIPEIANASSYVWTLPPGASGNSTTNSITVKYSLYSSSGDITVKGINCNGEGAVRKLPVIVNELPLELDIVGPTKICKGDTVIYSVSPIDGATSYSWSGMGIVKKISPTSILVCSDNSLPAGGGFGITLTIFSDCGEKVESTLSIGIVSSPTNQLPGSAGLITGTTSVFPGQNSVVYSVPAIENASSYIWTLPEGATGSSTSKNIVVNYSKSAKYGKVTVKGKNLYGEGSASALAINIISLPENSLPEKAGPITGASIVTPNINHAEYSIASIAGASSYLWTLPEGATGTSKTNSILVNFSIDAEPGEITVKGVNSFGQGISSTMQITVNHSSINKLPDLAGKITGPSNICKGEWATYTVPPIPNATYYSWWCGENKYTYNNSITIQAPVNSSSFGLIVRGNNTLGSGESSSIVINVTSPPTTPLISSTGNVLHSDASTGIQWYSQNGIINGATTQDYKVMATGDYYAIQTLNGCSSEASNILHVVFSENSLPADAGTITGTAVVTQGQNSVIYTIPSIANATTYIWTLPSGTTGTSATNSITVNYGLTAMSGHISVKGHNSFGDGVSSTLAITVNSLPADAGAIAGTSSVNQGQNSVIYTVPSIANASSYIWTLPTGATGTSTTNSITVNYGLTAISGNITVKGHNSFGDGVLSTLAITVNSLPADAGTITGTAVVTQGQNSVIYTIPSIANATTYIWTLPSGATGTSATNSITVNYGLAAMSGHISVKGHNSFGDGVPSILAITVNSLPVIKLPEAAGTITGPASICKGGFAIYSVPVIPNATIYRWEGAGEVHETFVNNTNLPAPKEKLSSFGLNVTGINSSGRGTTSMAIGINLVSPPATPIISSSGNVLHSNVSTGNQWYDQHGIINGAITQDYKVASSGDYYAIQTLDGCSSEASNILHVVVSGIGEIKNDKPIKVYPNPFTNELIIEIEGNNEKQDFEILNTIGQVVFKGSIIEKTTLRTGNFVPGIYLIKLKNGKYFEFKKLKKG